jgi:hypothetical protein
LGESLRSGSPCREINTFENINGKAKGLSTLHCGTPCNGGVSLSLAAPFDYGAAHTRLHSIDVMSPDWTQQLITFKLDGNMFHVVNCSNPNNLDYRTAVSLKAMYIMLNVAAGNFSGAPAADTVVESMPVWKSTTWLCTLRK